MTRKNNPLTLLRSRLKVDDQIPDVRDGMTRLERIILVELQRAAAENNGRPVASAMLYGRVVEHVNVSVPEFQHALERMVGRRGDVPG